MLDDVKAFWQVIKAMLTGTVPGSVEGFDQSVIDSDRNARNIGYLIIAAVFVGFGGWAAFAPLESAARGMGVVQVQGSSKPIQHLEGGIVSDILVTSGDYVAEGQALIQLESAQFVAEQQITSGRLWAMAAKLDRLKSERDDLTEVRFSAALRNEAHERAKTAIGSETALFNARRADRLGEIAVLEQRISQLQKQMQGDEAVVKAKQNIAESLQTEIADLNDLLSDGYVDKQRIRQLDRSLAETLGAISELRAKIASAQVSVEEARLKITQLTKRFITGVVDELTESQEAYFDLEQKYIAVTDRVDRSTIRSPVSGYVMAVLPKSVGAVVRSGTDLMQIVPDVGKFIVDVQMSPMDIDRIRVGQEAEVRFAVFKDSYTVTGELTKISADAMVNESTGQPFYEAKVELFEEDMALLGEEELVPGMPADVLVKTGSRTLLDYLTSPLQRMFENSLIED